MDVVAEYGDPARFDRSAAARRRDQNAVRRPWSAGPRFNVTSATRGGACGGAASSAAAGTRATPPAATPAPMVAEVICALKARVAGTAATGVPGGGTSSSPEPGE